MGQAARINAARRQQVRPPIEWLTCAVCRAEFPVDASIGNIERLAVCDRCCVADLATLVRRNYELVRMLPTVRVLHGKDPIVEVMSPGVAEALCS